MGCRSGSSSIMRRRSTSKMPDEWAYENTDTLCRPAGRIRLQGCRPHWRHIRSAADDHPVLHFAGIEIAAQGQATGVPGGRVAILSGLGVERYGRAAGDVDEALLQPAAAG